MGEAVTGDFELTMAELREVTSYVVTAAAPLLPHYEDSVAGDQRPRDALDAARAFATGERRTRLQQATALDAHRAAASAPTEVARLAAQAAGDAASAAYLHPIRKAHQVGHVLRASANAVRVAELVEGEDAARVALQRELDRATPVLRDVLRRDPPAVPGRSRVAVLMVELDTALRRR